MKQLRLAGNFMAISLASLGDYHDGSQGFIKQLRLAGSFMKKSLASLGGYHDGSQGSMNQLRLAESLMAISLVSLDGYHDGSQGIMKQLRLAGSFNATSRAPVPRFARRFSRSPRLPVLTSIGDLASRTLASLDVCRDGPQSSMKQHVLYCVIMVAARCITSDICLYHDTNHC